MAPNIPIKNRFKKIVGIGLWGAVISLGLLALAAWAGSLVRLPITLEHILVIKTTGVLLIIAGVGLHFWSFYTLRNWWLGDQLCTTGPFRYFRHPMYAAWITFISPGVALYLNSWFYLIWVFLLHLIWPRLVIKEELIMSDKFGDTYKTYASRTGRFFPRFPL